MVQAMTTSVVRQLGTLFAGGSAAGLSDRQLIERFVAGRDSLAAEAAFAALVARHGPMVLGVCRQLLGDRHEAEDAFQAVFLVLARRARSVRDPDLLSHWLYGVALRTARKARSRLSRLRRSEEDRAVNRPEACSAGRRRPGLARARAGRGPACGDRPPARVVAPAGRALLPRGPLAGRGRRAPPMPGRDRAQPTGPGPGEAPTRADPPGRGALDHRAGRRAWRPDRPRRPFLPSCAIPPRGPRSLRGPSRRRRRGALRLRRGAGPGGPDVPC